MTAILGCDFFFECNFYIIVAVVVSGNNTDRLGRNGVAIDRYICRNIRQSRIGRVLNRDDLTCFRCVAAVVGCRPSARNRVIVRAISFGNDIEENYLYIVVAVVSCNENFRRWYVVAFNGFIGRNARKFRSLRINDNDGLGQFGFVTAVIDRRPYTGQCVFARAISVGADFFKS